MKGADTRKARNRRSMPGQVMILFAAASLVLVGMAALAIDVGFLLAERRQNQAAVDAAALSAAKAVLDKKTSGEVQTAGKIYGAPNAGVAQNDVIVEWPVPGSGPRTGDKFVRVTITKDVQKYFLGAIYGGNWQVTNTAVAAIEPVPRPYALVALNPCPSASIKLNGSVKIYIDGKGSILSNCDITNTAQGEGSSEVKVGGSIDAVGTIQDNPAWIAPDGINEGSNPALDPLAGAQAPNSPSVQPTVPACVGSGPYPCYIEPGRYTSKNISIPTNATVCMRPGIYYLDGTTKVSLQTNSSILTNRRSLCSENPSGAAGGVLVYVTGGASIDVKIGQIRLSTMYPIPAGETVCNPADEPYANAPCGIVLWIANGSPFSSQAGAVTLFDGVVYAPTSTVKLQGAPGSDSQGLQVIVGALELGGSGVFNLKYMEYVKLDRPVVFLVE